MARGKKCTQHGNVGPGKCRECARLGRKRYFKTAKGAAAYRASLSRTMLRRTLRAVGITQGQYDDMQRRQGGVCAICQRPPAGQRLSVDHDHVSGAVRGLLCRHCNLGLGHFQDDPLRLQAAIGYLR